MTNSVPKLFVEMVEVPVLGLKLSTLPSSFVATLPERARVEPGNNISNLSSIDSNSSINNSGKPEIVENLVSCLRNVATRRGMSFFLPVRNFSRVPCMASLSLSFPCFSNTWIIGGEAVQFTNACTSFNSLALVYQCVFT